MPDVRFSIAAESPLYVRDIEGEHEVLRIEDVMKGRSEKELREFLRKNPEAYVRLYHGTGAQLEGGLKRTSAKTRRTSAVTRGYVYLSANPTTARRFGEFGYDGNASVWAADVKVKELKPDGDSIFLSRQNGRDIERDDLAASLFHTGNARVKRDIAPWEISPTRFSIGGVYTGSAADYEKPSLHYVGSGEGHQVYGWGLYGSTVRGVAEGYAASEDDVERSRRYREYLAKRRDEASDEWERKYFEDELQAAEEAAIHSTIYEQTFFTDRAPGDESHLLKWYGNVSDPRNNFAEQKKWIRAQAKKEGVKLPRDLGGWGEDIYKTLANVLGSPKAASEFLARAGIDGVKYPVDSYGKTVKDGDKVGWNYVSFRDDNIRVDHKWVDGQTRFSIGTGTMNAVRDFAQGKDSFIENEYGRIVYDFGNPGHITPRGKVKGGHGILHIVYSRMMKDGASLTEAVDTAVRVADAIETGKETLSVKNKRYFRKGDIEGIFADNGDGKLVLTGYKIIADGAEGASLVSSDLRTQPPPRKEEVVAALNDWMNNHPTPHNVSQSAPTVNGGGAKLSSALKADLSVEENAKAFKQWTKSLPAAESPRPIKDATPKNVFAWFEENMVGKTYSFDIPGYGHKEFKVAPGHIGKLVCSGKNKGAITKKLTKPWQEAVRDGEIDAEDVTGWDIQRARMLPRIPLVLTQFDAVLHHRDRGFDVFIFIKKFESANGRPNTIVMKIVDDNLVGPITTHIKDVTMTWLKDKDLILNEEGEVYSRARNISAKQRPLSKDNAESNSLGSVNIVPQSAGAVNGGGGGNFSISSAMPEGYDGVDAEAKAQYDVVYNRYHNADGTTKPGWMKAPNGKPTKLTERQWVQVRTPAFKKWFGDWEATAEISGYSLMDAKSMLQKMIKAKTEISTADGIVVAFSGQAKKVWSKEAEQESDNSAAHWAAVGNIENLIGRAIRLWEESPRNNSADIRAYVKHGAVFTFNGVPYLAKITTKSYPDADKQNLYSLESVSVEKINAHGIHKTITKGQSIDVSDERNISQLIDSVKSVSKVVDERSLP